MDVPVIEMEAEQAKEAFQEYREAVRSTSKEKYAEARREYEALDRAVMRGYREIAKGHALLKLSDALRHGGVEERRWEGDWWQQDRYVRRDFAGTFPRLAVCRADARHVFCSGVQSDGTVIFRADEQWSRRKADEVRVEKAFDAPENHAARFHRAIVPTIPPPLRPAHKLSGYHILWEAEWDLSAPVDPMLLKHLGGELYAVLAVWNLSELEQAVLGGMRG
jgi:hypothetical protein